MRGNVLNKVEITAETYIEFIDNKDGVINIKVAHLPPHTIPKILTKQLGLANDSDFVGRKEELQKVDELLNKNSMLLLLNGIGGIGQIELIDNGWLNYQIEHHLFPNLPLSQYQKMQPIVKEICAKHNLEYRQESVFKRMKMTVELMVGKTKLLRVKGI